MMTRFSDTPTTADIDTQLTKVASDRDTLKAEISTLQDAMFKANGDGDQVDSLALRIAATEAKLSNTDRQSAALYTERQAAQQRQIMGTLADSYADMARDTARVIDLNPAIQDAYAELEKLVLESNRLRYEIGRRRRPQLLRELITAAGLDADAHYETLRAQADALKAEQPDAWLALAPTAAEAEKAAKLGFAAPGSGLKVDHA